jgi:iron complex transport system ATP-binding protein
VTPRPPAIEVDPDLVVSLRGVDVRRGDKYLLRDVNWDIELDERWVVLGPNGAGKTTLLQLLSAAMHPTAGTVHLLGEQLGRVDVQELKPRIGIASAALAQRIPPQERVTDIVVSAGYAVIGRWREAYGLLDEPAAGLDLGGREDLVARLSRIALDPDAATMVLVTHHVEEIPPGATHVLLLREGRVQAAGLLSDVLTPQSLSATFDLPLTVERLGGRWFARAL